MTYDVEQLIIYIFAICITSLIRYLFRYLAHLELGCCMVESWVLFILDSSTSPDMYLKNFFLPDFGLYFYPLDIVFFRAEKFKFNKVQLVCFFFNDHAFGSLSTKSAPCPQPTRISPILPFTNFTVLCFIFRLLIFFGLIFVKDVWSYLDLFSCMWMFSCSNTMC